MKKLKKRTTVTTVIKEAKPVKINPPRTPK